MDFLRIKTPFCGAGKLEHVALFIGYFYLILSLAGISAAFGYMVTNYNYPRYYDVNFFAVLYGVSCVIWSVVNFCLLYGIAIRQRKFLLPWLQWHVVFTLVSFGVLVWGSIKLNNLLTTYTYYENLRNAAIYLLTCVGIYFLTVVYFMIVVYSFYRDISEMENITDTSNQFVKDRHVVSSVPQQAATIHRPPPPVPQQAAAMHQPLPSIPQQAATRNPPQRSATQHVASRDQPQLSVLQQEGTRGPTQRSVSHLEIRDQNSLQAAITGKMKQMKLSPVTPNSTQSLTQSGTRNFLEEHNYEVVK